MVRPVSLVACATDLFAQRLPYDVFPPADPPYYRVRYEAGARRTDTHTNGVTPGIATFGVGSGPQA